MTLPKTPFKPYRDIEEIEADKKRSRVISVKLNVEELKLLSDCQGFLNQRKESTALKQVFKIGSKVILRDFTGQIIKEILENRRKNERVGIVDFE